MISEDIILELEGFLKKTRSADLVTTYLFYLEKKFKLDPVLFIREKTIYKSEQALVRHLESQNKLWRETPITIQVGLPQVDAETKKIYLCPFCSKIYADNTHVNPQDAIYDHVSKCTKNTERVGGLRVKKFFTSEDSEIIKNYIEKRDSSIEKIVFTSAITGKLHHNKKAVMDDFKKNHIKHIPMKDVPTQNRFEIQEDLLEFIQKYLDEGKIAQFVETLADTGKFDKQIKKWTEES